MLTWLGNVSVNGANGHYYIDWNEISAEDVGLGAMAMEIVT